MTIIQRLLPLQDMNALIGDITEEARHRSYLWYWGQIAAVVVVGTIREVRRHPLLMLRAIAVGIASLTVLLLMVEPILKGVLHLINGIQNSWLRSLDQAQREAFGSAAFFVAAPLLFYGGLATSGWTVGRIHRRHGITLVLPFATLVTLSLALLAIVLWLSAPPGTPAQPFRSWADCIRWLAIPFSILTGGYWSTRRMNTA